jgi:hypothetical protein
LSRGRGDREGPSRRGQAQDWRPAGP